MKLLSSLKILEYRQTTTTAVLKIHTTILQKVATFSNGCSLNEWSQDYISNIKHFEYNLLDWSYRRYGQRWDPQFLNRPKEFKI